MSFPKVCFSVQRFGNKALHELFEYEIKVWTRLLIMLWLSIEETKVMLSALLC